MIRPDPSTEPFAPVRFTPDMEVVRDDEIETISEIGSILRAILADTLAREGRAQRAAHARCHGIVRGELAVLESLDPVLRQGVFAEPRVYPVLLRFSTDAGARPDDGRSEPKGVGLKIVGVEGDRLPGAEGERTQDFVMADAPAFAVPDARAFLESLRRSAAASGRARFHGRAASVLGGVEALIEAAGGQRPADRGGKRDGHMLSARHFTQVPVLFGPYVAKLRLSPAGADLASIRGETIEVRGRPEAQREAVADFFESQTASFDLDAQLLTDASSMPIEDASIVWPEAKSPFRTLARITVPPQPVWDAARADGAEASLSFSPWHGLAAHRPLGSIMRARRPAYAMSASFRASRNGCPIHNPRAEADLPI